MQDLLSAWDGESVSIHRDRESGAWMFICVHSTRLGPAAGGTRMKHYPRLEDALADGMRLAEAMSLKFASVEFPHGGGKAVIALPTPDIPQDEARRRLLHEYGTFVNSLGGLYSCAPDMNTSAVDMDVIAEVTPYVFCKTEAAGGANNQLETPEDADRLRKRGIAYAPDFVINSGGVLHGGGLEELRWSRETLDAKLAGIGDAVYEILTQADRDGVSTDAAARQIALARIFPSPLRGEG